MEMNVLDTLGKLWRHGHGMFGWCSECGLPRAVPQGGGTKRRALVKRP